MLNDKIKGSGSFFRDILRNSILLLLVPMITILSIFSHADKTVKAQVQESASKNFSLYVEQMEDITKGMRATCLSIFENEYCRMYSRQWVSGSQYEVGLKLNVCEILSGMIDSRYLDVFIYYERTGHCVSGKYASLPAKRYYEAYYGELGKEAYEEEFLSMIKGTEQKLISSTFKGYRGESYYCMAFRIRNGIDASDAYTICVVLSPEYLNDTFIMRNMSEEDTFLTYNSEWQPVLNNTSLTDGFENVDELMQNDEKSNVWLECERYMVQVRDSEVINNKYVYIVPNESFWRDLEELRLFCLCGIVLCIIISVLFTYRGARRTYAPLQTVVEMIRKQEDNLLVEAKRQKEFACITSYVNNRENKMREYKRGIKELSLHSLLEGKSGKADPEALAQNSIMFPCDKYAVCLFMVEREEKEITGLDHFVIGNVMEELGDRDGRAYMVELSRNRAALIMNLDGGREEIQKITKEGQDFLLQYFQLTLTIGISGIHHELSQIADAYREAQEALRYRFLMGRGCQINYEDISGRGFRGQKKESKLYFLILDYVKGEGETCNVDSFVDSLGYIYEMNEDVSVDMAYFYKNEVVTSLKKIMALFEYEETEQVKTTKALMEADTLIEFKEKLSEYIAKLRAENGEKKPKEDICAKTRRYIEENFSDMELSVNVIGQRMGMQPAHLSKIFKEAYGISISDYLSGVRINEAKRMMKELDMSVQETAEKTGFISSHAFIRMFKKLENMTPGKYREICKK